MLIGGLQKTSLLDYPDKVAAIIFTSGCNFRCGFCYNAHLVTAIDPSKLIPEQEVLDFLASRKNKLEAVVITGGEPTLHPDLPDFIKKIKALGLLVKLDTNGTNPALVQELIVQKLLDYLAMDIKGPLPKYDKIVKVNTAAAAIQKSINLIMNCGLPYEFRSTLLPTLHTREDLVAMSQMISGAEQYFLQKFLPADSLNDQSFRRCQSFTDREMAEFVELCSKNVQHCAVR